MENQPINNESVNTNGTPTKFCKHCGEKIPVDAVICVKCGRQVEEIKNEASPQVVVNNNNDNSSTNANVNTNVNENVNANVNSNTIIAGKACNKWVSLILCCCLGIFGAHKFYEGKTSMGILYLCTVGLFGFGVCIDFFSILFKPNPYYVV